LGYNQNGERDIITYIEHVKPRYFIPNHVTAVAAEGRPLFVQALLKHNGRGR